MLYLNVPKSIMKWTTLKHIGDRMRARAQAWFKSLGISIDFRHKDRGRDRQEKWCSGDQWARVIKGCPRNPNGMDGLAAAVADWLVEQHCLDLETDETNTARCAQAATIRQQWAAFDLTGCSDVKSFLKALLGTEASSRVLTAILAYSALHDLTKALNDTWSLGLTKVTPLSARCVHTALRLQQFT